MKKLLLILVLFLSFFNSIQAQSNAEFFEQSNEFLQNNVNSEGKVNYSRLKRSPGELLYILNNISTLKQTSAKNNEKMAFWINVYNLTVIKNIVQNYPLRTVNDVPDFFDQKSNIADDKLSLNDVEEILKTLTDNQGINFALSKGKLGSPRLLNAAYLPETLDYQISLQVKTEINKPGFIKVDKNNKIIEINHIFSQYKSEFVTHYFNEIDFINVFLEKKIDSKLKISYLKDDLALNESK